MDRLFNDGFTSYDLDHCGLLVVSIISSIFGVCIMKVGQCILIKPKDKWLCVKYYSHNEQELKYVPMHIDMLLKRHIRKMKLDLNRIRSIHQGKGDKPLKGGEQLEFIN